MKNRHKPLVSVIIPAYNSAKYLNTCVESVLGQTWTELEIIIVNDGSTDNTLQVAEELCGENIHVVDQPNRGGCAARNAGLALSRGKYLQFLDADDLISPDKIESQVKLLEEFPGHVAVCQTVHFTAGENPTKQPLPDESMYLYNTTDVCDFFSTLWGADGQMHMVQTSAWLIPRQLTDQAGGWNERILLDQDGEFFTRVALHSNGIRRSNGVNYYRKYIHGNNVASKYKKMKNLQSALESARLKTGYLLNSRNDSRSRKAVANVFMQLAIDSYPQYPALFHSTMEMVRQQQEKPVIPVLGGRTVEMIKQLFGWKTAKRLSFEIHKITSINFQ